MVIYEIVANIFILGMSLVLIAVGALIVYVVIKILVEDWRDQGGRTMVDVHPEDFCPTCGRLPYNQLFENQCGHTMYLGSDDKSDYYLYVDTGHEELTMCIRYVNYQVVNVY